MGSGHVYMAGAVGERSMLAEAVSKGAVDGMEVIMLA
jgi:hypothetical protein